MNFVVVGLGSAGARHIKNLIDLKKKVIAGADPIMSDARIESIQFYKDPDKCLEKHAGGNVVVIASPTKYHVSQAMKAIDCGASALLIEKPPAVNAEECSRLTEAAETMGVKVAVGFNYRCHSAFYDVYGLSRREGLTVGHLQLLARDDIRKWPSYNDGDCYMLDPEGGGVLLTSASHGIDAALFVQGPAIEVAATVIREGRGAKKIEHTTQMIIRHRNESVSLIQNVWGSPEYSLMTYVSASASGAFTLSDVLYQPDRNAMHLRMMKTFTRWLEEDKEFDAICTIDQGQQVMEIIDAARISSEKGMKVEL
jgi:predicted dehydrogenase